MTKIFITAGLGDFLASECFFPEILRQNLEKIYYATPAQKTIIEIVSALPNLPKLKEQVILWKDFSKPPPYCFFHKVHYEQYCKDYNGPALPDDWHEVEDWSIAVRFKHHQDMTIFNFFELSKTKINIENFTDYTYSSILKYKLCDICELPKNSIVIFPCTKSFGTPESRNFNNNDWKIVLERLVEKDEYGIILGVGENIYVPTHSRIINFVNKTNVLQSIEILKSSNGYFGIDSWMSVLASKLFTSENIKIKSLNSHCYRYKHVYYYPMPVEEVDKMIYGYDQHSLYAAGLVERWVNG